jgi:hypothetical protein
MAYFHFYYYFIKYLQNCFIRFLDKTAIEVIATTLGGLQPGSDRSRRDAEEE